MIFLTRKAGEIIGNIQKLTGRAKEALNAGDLPAVFLRYLHTFLNETPISEASEFLDHIIEWLKQEAEYKNIPPGLIISLAVDSCYFPQIINASSDEAMYAFELYIKIFKEEISRENMDEELKKEFGNNLEAYEGCKRVYYFLTNPTGEF